MWTDQTRGVGCSFEQGARAGPAKKVTSEQDLTLVFPSCVDVSWLQLSPLPVPSPVRVWTPPSSTLGGTAPLEGQCACYPPLPWGGHSCVSSQKVPLGRLHPGWAVRGCAAHGARGQPRQTVP